MHQQQKGWGSRIKKLFRGWKYISVYTQKQYWSQFFASYLYFIKKNQIYTIITIHMKRTREQQQASVVAIIHNGSWEIKIFWISCRVGQKIRLKAEEAVYMMANISIIYKHIWIDHTHELLNTFIHFHSYNIGNIFFSVSRIFYTLRLVLYYSFISPK
jgi:hypothetical protein